MGVEIVLDEHDLFGVRVRVDVKWTPFLGPGVKLESGRSV